MKKIILLLAFCLSVGNLFAQDANADKLREEGDAAMTAKNYPEVVAKYSEYLKLTNYEDEALPLYLALLTTNTSLNSSSASSVLPAFWAACPFLRTSVLFFYLYKKRII